MNVALIPSKATLWLGEGDHLLNYLRWCFEQAIRFRIVTLSTSVRESVALAACRWRSFRAN